jgi:2'-5' RNA ligase
MARAPTARLFVALDPPAEVCEELAAWARLATAGSVSRPAGGARAQTRLLAPETLHLTVCFLGSRPVAEIPLLCAALSACAAPVGELQVGAPLWLPPRRPRALAVEVRDGGEGELEALHDGVSSSIAAVTDWEMQRRRYRAHITLARLGGRPPRTRLSGGSQAELPATPQLRFTPEAIHLYRSWLSPAGASYESLARCELLPRGL